MVEIAYLAQRSKLSIRETLERLMDAGVDSLPGGGAEIFHDRVRRIICDHKIDGQQWLEVARTAHQLGLKSNCTMLYGHIETEEDRVDHLVKLRELQEDTGGFQTFIPLAFHPANTALEHIATTTGFLDLKMIAVSRLMLDNIDHIKAYWIMMTPKDRADRAALRRRRSGRHGGGREDLPRCRRDHQPGFAAGRIAAADSRSRPRADGARYAVPAGNTHREQRSRSWSKSTERLSFALGTADTVPTVPGYLWCTLAAGSGAMKVVAALFALRCYRRVFRRRGAADQFHADSNLVLINATVLDRSRSPGSRPDPRSLSAVRGPAPSRASFLFPKRTRRFRWQSSSMLAAAWTARCGGMRAALDAVLDDANPQDEFSLVTFADQPTIADRLEFESSRDSKTVCFSIRRMGKRRCWTRLQAAWRS